MAYGGGTPTNLDTSDEFFCSASWRNVIRPSVHIRNKYGEMGSPCRSLLDGCIRPFGVPLMIIDRKGVNTTHDQLHKSVMEAHFEDKNF